MRHYNSSESYDITTENGHSYHLYGDACLALLEARTAREAEEVFEELADDVPTRHRCGVWFAV